MFKPRKFLITDNPDAPRRAKFFRLMDDKSDAEQTAAELTNQNGGIAFHVIEW